MSKIHKNCHGVLAPTGAQGVKMCVCVCDIMLKETVKGVLESENEF